VAIYAYLTDSQPANSHLTMEWDDPVYHVVVGIVWVERTPHIRPQRVRSSHNSTHTPRGAEAPTRWASWAMGRGPC